MREVIESYWGDYSDHQNDFVPAFLANDVLRLWRTFCVNYEANTEREPAEKKAKRKLKNYKLKHSRLLTCYSALLYLLAVYGRENSVSPKDAFNMVKLTPTERLEWLQEQPDLGDAREHIDDLLSRYELFLKTTNETEDTLIRIFSDSKSSGGHMNAAQEFGDSMFEVLSRIGNKNRLHRLLVV